MKVAAFTFQGCLLALIVALGAGCTAATEESTEAAGEADTVTATAEPVTSDNLTPESVTADPDICVTVCNHGVCVRKCKFKR
jgi:hypothetical protein